LSFILYRL